jgi:hypothetical protein
VGGWRTVIQEILIVVSGVLIALGAQQLGDGWQWRRRFGDFRAAIDAELGRNLESYRLRIEQRQCVRDRLSQLGAWADAHEAGEGGRLRNAISRPLGVRLQFSVWDQAGEAASHMPLQQRLAYAELYDEFRNYAWLRVRERELWFDIRHHQGAGRLSDERQLDLRVMIAAAHSIDDSMAINWRSVRHKAAALGIRPVRDPEQPDWRRNLGDPLRWEER